MAQDRQTTYLITGCGRGIGFGLVKALLQRPNTTIVAATRDGTAGDLTQLPRAKDSHLIAVKIDSRSETDAATTVKLLQTEHAITQLDVVIANAGISNYSGPVVVTPIERMQDHFAVNTLGPLRLFQAAWPLISAAGSPKFVVISSVMASLTDVPKYSGGCGAYGSSKAAVNFLVQKINAENPHLVAFPIHPGWVQSDMGNAAAARVGLAEAPTTVSESVQGIIHEIDIAVKETCGRFVGWDHAEIPW